MKPPRELLPLLKLQEELDRAVAEGWVDPFAKTEVLEAAAECDRTNVRSWRHSRFSNRSMIVAIAGIEVFMLWSHSTAGMYFVCPFYAWVAYRIGRLDKRAEDGLRDCAKRLANREEELRIRRVAQ